LHVGCWSTLLAASAFAEAFASPPTGAPVNPEQARAMAEAQKQAGKAGQPPGQPAQPGQEAKPEEKKKDGEEAKKEGGGTVKRPEKPPRVPDPREFQVHLDEKGRIPPFNFIGQPWPEVMQWLATQSKATLDYQELPSDYLNLTTDRPYPLDEVHDRINRTLQARGFTSVKYDDVLSVFKIDKIDPSLVRRVTEEQLYDMKPYDFVKVSFELPPGMEVDKAKDDVKQILNPTAKVFPLVTSKRLLIMDTVANLRTVSELFNTERMIQDGRIVPKEYFLKYTRPQQVIEILYMMVGVDPKARPAQTDPQQQQQQMQMIQQMQQQGRAAEAAKLMQKGEAPKIYLAYNRQRNSVLVNAPPEQLKIIEQTIKYLDVPYGDAASPITGGSPVGAQRVMKHYSLYALDPDRIVATLEEIGGFSPDTVFKVDDDSKTLFALASPADQKKIESLLRDFDGSGRKFKVIQLRRKPADLVAATIQKMMAGQNEKKDDNRRRYYSFWDDYYGDQNNKKKDTIQGFGVDADVENNQLLLWANEIELERVRELLIEMGELPDGQPDLRPVRFIEPTDERHTPELLKRLQEAWKSSGGGELIIKAPPPSKPAPPADDKDNESKEKAKSDKSPAPANDRAAQQNRRDQVTARFVQLSTTAAPADADATKSAGVPADRADANVGQTDTATKTGEPGAKPSQQPAPVTITVTPEGRLMLSSSDPAALDRMEQLIEQLSPPQRRFKIIPVRHISAIDMYLDLKNYFKEDLEQESGGYTRDWFGFMVPRGNTENKSATGLAKRRKLMLDWDPPSNSIIVANASASQMAEIEQLMVELDKPPRSDSVEKRTTKAIKIKYSRPSVIATAIKEVYRDLLSSRDKEFASGDQKDKKASAERVTVINYGGGGGEGDDGDRSSSVKLGFDGALSLGADDVSSVLIVSAQQGIFSDIERMVQELDEQAAPKTTVHVHRVYGTISAESLQKALDKAVGKAWLGNRPEQQPNQTGPEAEKKNAEKERGNRNNRQDGDKRD
jgi:type II secretory pathway component GspD/PulD (secretin)